MEPCLTLYATASIVVLLASIITALLGIALYRLYWHPLAGVPGPPWAALSNVWQGIHVRNGRARILGKTLHEQYGPVVRVGPNEVWFNSPEAFRKIYSAGRGFEKSEFYLATALNKPRVDWRLNVSFPDTLDLLSEFDVARYRLQRRLIGPVYSTSNLKRHEHAIDRVIARLITELKSLNGKEVDLKEWMHIVAVECLGSIVLSWSPGYIKNRSDGGTSKQSYLGWKRKSVFGLFPTVTKVAYCSKIVSRLWSVLWGVTFKTPKGFKPFFTVRFPSHCHINGHDHSVSRLSCNQCAKAFHLLTLPPQAVYQKTSKRISRVLHSRHLKGRTQHIPPDLLTDLIQLHLDRPQFTDTYLRRLAITNFGAGHETLASTLTAAMAMIGTHPDVHAKIVREVRYAAATTAYDDLVHLRYTKASIKEAQRLYPVIGMSLPRTVPDTGLYLHGRFFPPGTTVGCSPLGLHLNADIFGKDASRYNPERWLQDDIRVVRNMERFNLIWGGGGRSCPGRHLAELIIAKVIPALLREFDVTVTRMPSEEEMPHYFMSMLTGVKVEFSLPGEGK